MDEIAEVIKPTISFDEHELPALKKWKVDGKYVLILHVTQISSERNTFLEGKPLVARFEIDSVAELDPLETSPEDHMNMKVKVLEGKELP